MNAQVCEELKLVRVEMTKELLIARVSRIWRELGGWTRVTAQ